MTEISSTEAQAVADLGRLSTEIKPYELDDLSSLVVVRVRTDERIQVESLEHHLAWPRTPRGSVVLHDHKDFALYVNRLGDDASTTVWADADRGDITSVLNDHESGDEGGQAGWRDHRVTLQLREDADWALWLKFDGKLMSQALFAEHLENMVHTIVEPSAADMLEVSKTFQAKRSVDFSQGVRLDNGDVQLAYQETTAAKAGSKGHLEIPSVFTLALSPFVGSEAVAVTARLRYRIEESGKLGIGYALMRPDLVRRAAFDTVLAAVREQLDTEAVFNGTAPAALR